LEDVLALNVRIVNKELVDGATGTKLSDNPTVTRMPRMQGLPPIIPGCWVMRSKSAIDLDLKRKRTGTETSF